MHIFMPADTSTFVFAYQDFLLVDLQAMTVGILVLDQ